MAITFGLTVLAWIFFRSDNIAHALNYINTIFSKSLFTIPIVELNRRYILQVALVTLFFLTIEWKGREKEYAIEKLGFSWNPILRRSFYIGLIFLITIFLGEEQQFIYFQF
jgi:hypothetical protein